MQLVFFMFFMTLGYFSHAIDAWRQSNEIRVFITENYPHLAKALHDHSYETLQNFNPYLNIGITISEEYPQGANLSKSILVGSRWSDDQEGSFLYDFSAADLSFSDLSFADLRQSYLTNAKAHKARFHFSLLSCSHIRGADFSGAEFFGSQIAFEGTLEDVTKEILVECGALIDEKTDIESFDLNLKRTTSYFFWFPFKEIRPGGDPCSNLYAKNGPLEKLDRVTGAHAQSYDYYTNRITFDEEDHDSNWMGHGHAAAAASCLLYEPKRSVAIRAQNGEVLTFSPHDIQGLVISVIGNLYNTDFAGQRGNPDAFTPPVFLEILSNWKKQGLPIIVNRGYNGVVWNQAYDNIEIKESSKAPAGFSYKAKSPFSTTTFYSVELTSTGYPNDIARYGFFIERDGDNTVLQSGFINNTNYNQPPDFMWRAIPKGDLLDAQYWKIGADTSGINPQVDPHIVFDMYMMSL